LGVTPIQAVICVLLAVPVLVALAAGDWPQTVVWLAVDGPLAVLVVVPVRGRPALRWLGDLLLFQLGVLTGWSVWQSRAAAGAPGPAGEPDLPGVLARLRFPDGPVFADRGRICVIHDTVEGRWGATAQLTHSGTGMLSAAECDQLAARLATLLTGIGHREVVDRLSLYVRTVPDDGAEYRLWRARHTRADAPQLARRATAELDASIGAVSLRTELFVCVSGREDVLRRPAEAAGGGVTGRALALYRALHGIEDGLTPLGVQQVSWLSSARMAVALRTGFNPATAPALATERLRGAGGDPAAPALPLAAAGPTLAPTSAARAYHHDGFSTVSYAVLMPDNGLTFGALGPLLAVRTAGERRTLALHYQVLSARASARAVQRHRFRTGLVRDLKASRGFATTAADQRSDVGARDQEHAVAAGAALVRFAVAAAVTVPSSWAVEDHAAWLENDAAGRVRLLRLELAQDSAFVAAVLPVGIGLPRQRRPLT
jgi:hypothetical protein